MSIRKALTLLLAMAMVLTLLVCGCSSEDPGATSPGTEIPADQSGAGQGAQDYTLPLSEERVVFTNFSSMNPQMADFISEPTDATVTRVLSEITNVWFEYKTFHPSAQSEQFNLMLSSGDWCDTFGQVNSTYAGGFSGALDDGIILDLSELISQYAPNYNRIINSSKDLISASRLPSGAIPAFANLFQESVSIGNGLMIRNDWLVEQNLERPQTYDEYYNVLKVFKSEYNASMWMAPNGMFQDSVFASGLGIAAQATSGRETELLSFYVEDGTVKCGIMQDAFLEYLELMNKWYGEGLIYQDFISGDMSNVFANQDAAVTGVYNGSFGIWLSMTENFTDYDIQFDDQPGVDIRAAYVPVKNRGDKYDIGYYYCQFNSWANSISATVDQSKVKYLIQYLDYRYSDEGAFLVEWGVQGEAYELDANGNPYYTDLILNNPDGMSMRQALQKYAGYNGAWADSKRLYAYTYNDAALESDGIWTSNYTQSKTYPNLIIQYTDEETAIQAQRKGDIITCIQEWVPQFIMGLKPLSEFENFQNNLIMFGIEEFTGTYQSAYDRFKAL